MKRESQRPKIALAEATHQRAAAANVQRVAIDVGSCARGEEESRSSNVRRRARSTCARGSGVSVSARRFSECRRSDVPSGMALKCVLCVSRMVAGSVFVISVANSLHRK